MYPRMPERRRVFFAFAVCVLQPLTPGATMAPFHRYIWTPDHELARSIPAWVLLASAISGAVTVAVLVGGVLLRGGRLVPADIGWRRDAPVRTIALGIAGAAAATAAPLGTTALFGGDPSAGLHQMLGYSASQRVLFASVGLTLALVEESFFRGNLQRRLTERLGFPIAYALTAVVFTVWHFPMFRIESMTARLGQGLVYGALRGRDRPLQSAVIAHALCWSFVGLY